MREAACVRDQEEGTLENEKRQQLETGRGAGRDSFDLVRIEQFEQVSAIVE